jgi:hypothetical protein
MQSSACSDMQLHPDDNDDNSWTVWLHFLRELKDSHCGEATIHPEDHFLSAEI